MKPKRTSVKELAAFFDNRNTTFYPKSTTPQTLSSHSTQTNSQVPQELPAMEIQTPLTDLTLSLPITELKKNYFEREPINQRVICLELQRAITYKAPLHYQERLLTLLREQTEKVDALCVGVKDLATNVQTQQSLSHEMMQKKRLNHSVSFCEKEEVTAHALHSSNNRSAITHLHITPSQEALQSYPTLLIDIIEQFLNLIQEPDYQSFLEQIIYDKNKYSELGYKAQHTSARKIALMQNLRIRLNIEFREMMRLVLHSLFINLRKELSLNQLWQTSNPIKLLTNLHKEWMTDYENSLQPYLKRADSHRPKVIPIEFPIVTSYKAKVIHRDEQGIQTTVYPQEKVDDLSRWIARIERCEVAPLGNIDTQENQLDETYCAWMFSSHDNFINWLRKDPSLSFFYTNATPSNDQKTSLEETRTIVATIAIADIKPIHDGYFKRLEAIIRYFNTLERQHFYYMLCSPLGSQWSLNYQNALQPHLKSLQPDCFKFKTIEYPLVPSHIKNVDHGLANLQTRSYKIETAGDLLSWMTQVERCHIVSLGNIDPSIKKLEPADLAWIFSSDENFTHWLRTKVRISLFDTKEDRKHQIPIISSVKIFEIILIDQVFWTKKLIEKSFIAEAEQFLSNYPITHRSASF